MNRYNPFHDRRIPDPMLDEYLRLCHETYLTMKDQGTWPWPDSQNPEDLLESDNT
tara:strand:- start:7277 stop:7441 length:165 start_codon:yes stop_codon:yes gene_type:complete